MMNFQPQHIQKRERVDVQICKKSNGRRRRRRMKGGDIVLDEGRPTI